MPSHCPAAELVLTMLGRYIYLIFSVPGAIFDMKKMTNRYFLSEEIKFSVVIVIIVCHGLGIAMGPEVTLIT